MFPSWDCKYTTNINLEMNYWPAEVTNLSDLNGPLFQLIREVSQTGAQTARIMYGKDGWVLHHKYGYMESDRCYRSCFFRNVDDWWRMGVPAFVGTLSVYRR
jgi:hypothetical protein